MRKFLAFLTIVFLLFIPASVSATNTNIYGFTALTGNTSKSLDGISGDLLSDGDMAFGIVSGVSYTYTLHADSGAAAVTTRIIPPATTPGAKRWELVSASSSLTGPTVDVRLFGASSDGTNATATTTAIQAAIDFVQTINGVVYFPAGIYLVDATLTISAVSGITLLGDGQQWNSIIKRASDYGDTLDISGGPNVEIRNLHFQTTTDTTSGAHIHINDSTTRIVNCYLDGQFGGIWLEGRSLEANKLYIGTGYLWASRKVGSYGLKISKSAGTYPNGYARITDFEITGNPTSATLDRGIEISSADGIVLSNGHVGFTYASDMHVVADPADTQLTGIFATNVWFDAMNDLSSEYGVIFAGTSTGTSGGHRFNGCQFSPAANSNVKLADTGATNFMFVNSLFDGAGLHGIDVGSDRVLISGNQFSRNNRLGGASSDIYIAANTNEVEVIGNQLGLHFSTMTAYNPSYNIEVAAGTGDYIRIGNNWYRNAAVSSILDGATGTHNNIDTDGAIAWTPGLSFGDDSEGITYNTGSTFGKYTRTNNMVNATGLVVLTSKGTHSTGVAKVTGLPVLVGTRYSPATVRLVNVTFANVPQGYAATATSTILLEEVTEAGVVSWLTNDDFANDSQVLISVTYSVD